MELAAGICDNCKRILPPPASRGLPSGSMRLSVPVPAAAAANFVTGVALIALGVVCLAAGGETLAHLLQIRTAPGEGGPIQSWADLQARGAGGVVVTYPRAVAACSMIQGVSLLLIGAGLLYRNRAARSAALAFAALTSVEGIACLMLSHEGTAFLIVAALLVGHAGVTFAALFGPRADEEFPRPSPARPAAPPRPLNRPLAIPERKPLPSAVLLLTLLAGAAAGAAGLYAYEQYNRPAAKEPLPPLTEEEYKARADGLLDAADRGQVSRLFDVLRDGVNVNDKGADGETALMKACGRGNVHAVLVLLIAGAQPNEKDRHGGTALMRAAENGHGAIVDVLMGKSVADAELAAVRRDWTGWTANGSRSAARALDDLKAGLFGTLRVPRVEEDARDDEGQTAFMKAVVNENHAIAHALLGGAEPAARDVHGNNIYLLAAARGRLTTLQQNFILQNGELAYTPDPGVARDLKSLGRLADMRNDDGMEAWMLAAANGHLATTRWLIESQNVGRDRLARKNAQGKSALQLAADNGHQEVAAYLFLLSGDETTPPEVFKEAKEPTPLMNAVKAGDLDAIQRLVNEGADVEVRDSRGRNVLMNAADQGEPKVVLLLAAHVARTNPLALNARDKEGRTALMLAAAGGHTAAVESLLIAVLGAWDRGKLNWFACLEARDRAGNSALKLAESAGSKQTADALRKACADNLNRPSGALRQTALEHLCASGNLPLVESLLKHKPALGQSGPKSKPRTALYLAAERGHILVVKALLDSFQDNNAARAEYVKEICLIENSSGGVEIPRTAREAAALANHPEIVALMDQYLNR
jgi:ankyrin repeat protein